MEADTDTKRKTLRNRISNGSYRLDVGEEFNAYPTGISGVSWMLFGNNETSLVSSLGCNSKAEISAHRNEYFRPVYGHHGSFRFDDRECESYPVLLVKGIGSKKNFENQIYIHPTSSMKIIGDLAHDACVGSSVVHIVETTVDSAQLVSNLPQEVIREIDKAIFFNRFIGLPISDEVLRQKMEFYVEPLLVLQQKSLSIELTASYSVNINVVLTENTSLFLKKPLNDVPELRENDFIFSLLFESEEVVTAIAPLEEILEGTRRFLAA